MAATLTVTVPARMVENEWQISLLKRRRENEEKGKTKTKRTKRIANFSGEMKRGRRKQRTKRGRQRRELLLG